MIPTDDDIKAIRQSIEAAAGMDDELKLRCGPLIYIGRFDEAVLNAFVLLEERLRKAIGEDGLTGVPLANKAFAADGPLSRRLEGTPEEREKRREGLRELYSGAFKLFRNPAAHGKVEYSSSEGKSIIGLVNLLLTILSRAIESLPPVPANVEAALSEAEKLLGTGTASRLRTFVSECIRIGLKPQAKPKQWIPFRRYALIQYSHWPEPKPYFVTVFYLVQREEIGLLFPVNSYLANVKGLSLSPIRQDLLGLGFTPTGKIQDYYLALHSSHNQVFFDGLMELVSKLNRELAITLKNKAEF
jgi:uncharacterized protein (TIGR02391 family)